MSQNIIIIDGPRLEPKGDIKKLVIFLHGYGSDGNDLISLTEQFYKSLPHTAFVSPHAPFPCGQNPMGGREWFPLSSLSYEEKLKGSANNHQHLGAFIDSQKQRHNLKEKDIALIGFSQGTMMALYVAPRRQKPLGAVIGFSGALTGIETLKKQTISRPPILLVHGDQDDVVPYSSLAEAEKHLKANKFKVKTHTSPGVGHGIGPDGIEQARQFLIKNLL